MDIVSTKRYIKSRIIKFYESCKPLVFLLKIFCITVLISIVIIGFISTMSQNTTQGNITESNIKNELGMVIHNIQCYNKQYPKSQKHNLLIQTVAQLNIHKKLLGNDIEEIETRMGHLINEIELDSVKNENERHLLDNIIKSARGLKISLHSYKAKIKRKKI